MTSPLRGPAARAVGLATAIVAVAALLLGLMAGALGNDAPPASAGPGAAAPAAADGSTAPAGPAGSDPTSPAPPEAPASPPGAPQDAPGRYVVVEGDTLASIADRSGVPVELIARDSGIADPDGLTVGQVLTISTPPRNVVVVVPGSSLGDYARELSTTVEQLLALNPQIQDPDVVRAGSGLRIAGG